jgi:hypothetical protein
MGNGAMEDAAMRDSDRHLTDEELLLGLDHELPAREQSSVDAHLSRCAVCQTRLASIERATRNVASLYRDDAVATVERHELARERLRAQLSEIGGGRHGSSAARLSSGWIAAPRWALVGAALVVTALLIRIEAPSRLMEASRVRAAVEQGALPVPSLTPGATWNVSVAELCDAGMREHRPIPAAMREDVLRSYGMEHVPQDQYELDYLITPELGGAADPRNLWPQRYASRVWNAHVKDQLERLLPRLVCDRRVALESAQHEIAADWIAAYKRYFKTDAPLQIEARRLRREGLHPDEREELRYPVWRAANAPTLELIAFSPRRR